MRQGGKFTHSKDDRQLHKAKMVKKRHSANKRVKKARKVNRG